MLGILENDYVPHVKVPLRDVLNILKSIYKKNTNCHAFQNELINVDFFRQFFAGLPRRKEGSVKQEDHPEEALCKALKGAVFLEMKTSRDSAPITNGVQLGS